MSIKVKLILIILPLFVFMLILTSVISGLTTRSGLINLAIEFFSFKANQFEESINSEWELLEENNLSEDPNFISSFEVWLSDRALQLKKSDGEVIFAYEQDDFDVIFNTQKLVEDDVEETATDESQLQSSADDVLLQESIKVLHRQLIQQRQSHLIRQGIEGNDTISDQFILGGRSWIEDTFVLADEAIVGYYFTFEPLNLVVILGESSKEFYQAVREIVYTTLFLIIFAIIVGVLIIIMYSNTLIRPLESMINSMHQIIKTNKFDDRMEVKFRDEVGILSNTFNTMLEELDHAYQQIKQYAFSAVLARKNESKIRNIFQKYVPVNVINSLFKDPTGMLMGENRELALMFTDIRRFTTISESYKPEVLVRVLNEYFEKLVDIITSHDGIIDKYIGDAIMAFFGAPVELENSPYSAINAGIKMVEVIDEFNMDLKKRGLPIFKTGIGINYGLVTVGNIGSEKKMDYTAIGDAVNLGSRLEGLTKEYQVDLIFSDSMREHIYDIIPCRAVDVVQVKGKTTGEKIYTTTPYINDKVLTGYCIHNQAFQLYLNRDFVRAKEMFSMVSQEIADDFLASMYVERCNQFIADPPPVDWDGTKVMISK